MYLYFSSLKTTQHNTVYLSGPRTINSTDKSWRINSPNCDAFDKQSLYSLRALDNSIFCRMRPPTAVGCPILKMSSEFIVYSEFDATRYPERTDDAQFPV